MPSTPPPPNGSAGGSAEREYERRRENRRARARRGFWRPCVAFAAVSGEPRSTQVWRQGAEAEQLIARALERRLKDTGVVLLHDRRIPYGGNIDHLAIGPAGIVIIDTKSTHGRLELKTVGGILTDRRELLLISGRDRTPDLDKLHRQLEKVTAALPADARDLEIHGVLCYPHAQGVPFLGRLKTRDGITITHPRGAAKLARQAGPLDVAQITALAQRLAHHFPPA